ncbi:MAG: hypothetical protein HOC71_06040 [Candidatus Latescibacteria bacterium]|jgi:hypothetical protein|nr:hypothetical protein [Candidatus Latescibacterota bacterium]
MKQFFNLYRSEVRNNLILAVFLYFAYYGIYTFSLISIYIPFGELDMEQSYSIWILFLTTYSLPFIVFYSLIIESGAKRNHILFSLPVSRQTVMISTYAALLSMVFIIPVGTLIFKLPFFPRQLWKFGKPIFHIMFDRQIDYNKTLIFFSTIILILSTVVMVSGILCAAKSLQTTLKKYKTVIVFIFLMTAQFFSLWLIKFLRFFYGPVPAGHQIQSDEALQLYFQSVIDFRIHGLLVNSGYMIAMGLLFLLVGSFLYEKYSDV